MSTSLSVNILPTGDINIKFPPDVDDKHTYQNNLVHKWNVMKSNHRDWYWTHQQNVFSVTCSTHFSMCSTCFDNALKANSWNILVRQYTTGLIILDSLLKRFLITKVLYK